MPDLRSDLAAFSRKVLGRPLWPHQLEAAASERFITTIAAARRTGKTVLAESMAVHTAFANAGSRVLVLSATLDSARRLTESIGGTLNANRLTRGAVVDDFSTRIRLANGSEIISLPASQRQVRGHGAGVLLVILDEAGFMPQELWTAASYTALDERANGSRLLLLGSPWGGPEAFFRRAFEAGQEGDPDHASYHWTYKANPRLDHAYLERQRERVSAAEYAAEVLGTWSDAQGSLFPRELLERNTADFDLPTLTTLHGPAQPMLGVDWGVSFDRSAAVAIGRLPVARLNPERPQRPTFAVAAVEVWPAGTRLTDVVSDVLASPAPWAVVSPEENGVGAGPSQELLAHLRRRAVDAQGQALQHYRDEDGETSYGWTREVPHPAIASPVATTAAKKATAYGWLLSLLEQERLVLPRHPDLLRQLAGLRYEQGERGMTRIESGSAGLADDVADACALATAPFSRDGRTTCRLARFSQLPLPDAEVPEPPETVTSGGGLVLPRSPYFQSVNGAELSLPTVLQAKTEPRDDNPVLSRARQHLATTRS
jgi:hypothetical protein